MRKQILFILQCYLCLTTIVMADILPVPKPKCSWIDNYCVEVDCQYGDEACCDHKLQYMYGTRWQEMKDFFFQFQEAIAANDKHKLADMVHYPFDVVANWEDLRTGKTFAMHNKKEFLALYSKLFPKFLREDFLIERYDELLIISNIRLVQSTGLYHNMAFGLRCKDKDEDERSCPDYKIGIIDIIYRLDSEEVNADFTRRRRNLPG